MTAREERLRKALADKIAENRAGKPYLGERRYIKIYEEDWAALEALAQPAAPAETDEGMKAPYSWPERDDKLPCDIRLPPATTITKGCDFRTLYVALGQRAKNGIEHFDATERAKDMLPSASPWRDIKDAPPTFSFDEFQRAMTLTITRVTINGVTWVREDIAKRECDEQCFALGREIDALRESQK